MIVRRGIGTVQTVGEGRNLLVPFKNDGTVANANVTNNISLINSHRTCHAPSGSNLFTN